MTDWKNHPRLVNAWAEGDRWGMEQHGEELGPFALWLTEHLTRHIVLMEIGIRRGGTLAFWRTLFPLNILTIGLDFEGFTPTRLSELEACYRRLVTVLGDSHSPQIITQVSDILQGEPLDFLFLDGDHTPAGVAQDFTNYAPMVRTGGVIGFHDITETPQNRALGLGTMDFWKALPGEKHEWICGAPWGGIGAWVKR